MATSYTSLLGLALPVTGELSGTWGDTVNDSITSLLDTAVAGTTTLSTDGDVTLTTTTGASNQARQAILLCTGARTALRTITAPARSKIYTVINATTGGYSVKVVGAGPTTGVTIVAGESATIAWNGSDFIKISNTGGAASFTNVTVSGTTTLSGLTASTALALNASKEVVSVTNTGTGNNVLSASPTLTGTVSGASLQLSSLTSGRVTYAGASGLLQDSANLTFDGTTLTANALTVTNAVTLSAGTANGVAYLNGSKVLTTGSALVFDGSNLGLGVTPATANNLGGYKAFEIATNGVSIYAGTNQGLYGTNVKWNGSTAKYSYSSAAALYNQQAGIHSWSTAASGSAGGTITFTQAMTLDASGNLLVGTTSGTAHILRATSGSSYSLVLQDNPGNSIFYVNVNGEITTQGGGAPYNNTTASAANMFVSSGGVFQRSTSALKYKQDIRDLELIDVDLFRPVRYKSKCANDDQTKDHFGVIADEVAEAGITELINYGPDGEVEGFQYERLTVVLLKELQSLRKRVAVLEGATK